MTFQRENRYIVVKLKDLDQDQEKALRGVMYGYHIPTRECLVIESDWPEYEPAWRMIQARVEGLTLPPAHIEDEREACERWIRQRSGMPAHIPMDWDAPFNRHAWAAWSARAALYAPPAAGVPEEWREDVSLAAQMLTWGDDDGGLTERQIGEIEQHAKKLFGMLSSAPTPPASEQQDEPEYGPTPGCKQCREALAIDLDHCPECDAEFHAPASEQQQAVVMPERKPYPDSDRCFSDPEWWARKHEEAKGWNYCLREFLRLNPHLAKGEGV